jgi:hypothetical protein
VIEAVDGNETIPSAGVCSFLNWIYSRSDSVTVIFVC